MAPHTTNTPDTDFSFIYFCNSENDRAFDILYCITFKLMDQQWLDMHATYMDFNTVMKSTRRQLERELLIEDIQRVEDMPSYKLLAR